MPDKGKKIHYSYTGDVTSLKKATTDAIKLLSKYEDSFKKVAKTGDMNVSQTSMRNFTREVKDATAQATELYDMLRKLSKTGGKKITGTSIPAKSAGCKKSTTSCLSPQNCPQSSLTRWRTLSRRYPVTLPKLVTEPGVLLLTSVTLPRVLRLPAMRLTG